MDLDCCSRRCRACPCHWAVLTLMGAAALAGKAVQARREAGGLVVEIRDDGQKHQLELVQ